jgi:hypothetical protein
MDPVNVASSLFYIGVAISDLTLKSSLAAHSTTPVSARDFRALDTYPRILARNCASFRHFAAFAKFPPPAKKSQCRAACFAPRSLSDASA